MKFESVIFDLDGTIVNSGEGIVKSVSYALEKMGIVDFDESENYRFIGPPLIESFMKFYSMTGEEARCAVECFRERYNVLGVHECSVYPGVRELLLELKKQGVKLYIGSSKPEKYIRQILENEKLAYLFDYISGATLDGSIETKEQVLTQLFENATVNKSTAVMVGDRFHDIEGAHALGLQCISVLYGFGNEAEFVAYGADYIAPSAEDVLKIIMSEE